MILWSLITALSITLILGDTTVNYDVTTTDASKSGAVDAALNETHIAPSLRDNCLSQGRFYCQSGGTCISLSWRCDGLNDCLNNEDELRCPSMTSTLAPTSASASSCGGTIYRSGYVRSPPNYPDNYGNYIRCNWTLIASPYNGNLVLHFVGFMMSSCCDFLSIYYSNGSVINRYAGAYFSGPLTFGSTVFITYTTNSTLVSSGFSIWFTTSAAPSCERKGNFYCATSDLCVSMSQRCNGYAYCNYREDEAGCSTAAPTTTTSAPSTTLSSRDSCERQGNFYCAVSGLCVAMSQRCNGYSYCYYGEDEAGCSTAAPTTTTPPTSICGGTLFGSGNVRSPNYPNNYGNYLRCNWTLIASPYNGNLLLYFDEFNTQSCCDFVSIYHINGTFINRYSGSYTPSSLTLGSAVVITFTTDSTGVSYGFSLRFTTSAAPSTTLSPRDSCELQGNFYCAASGLCVSMSQRCNGYSYCYYGEDEAGCSTAAPNITNPSRPSASQQTQGRFTAASGFEQAFLQLGKSSASELPGGSLVFVFGYVTALFLRVPHFGPP